MTSPTASGRPPLITRTTCRACGGTRLEKFLSLGVMPLANSFLTTEMLAAPEPRFPLEVYFCEGCALVQLVDVVDPEILFSNYLYRTGTNKTIMAHNDALAASAIAALGLGASDLVVEIASNDGSLLECFQRRGVRTLGVEPAHNIAAIARAAGIETLTEFFHAETARRIAAQYGPAKAVIANNVLAHVDATVDFLAACKQILHPGGRVIIEAPYLREMLERLEYDTIYHEHLCYFGVTPLTKMFSAAGLVLHHVDRVPIHGGSLRLWGRHAGEAEPDESVRELVAWEKNAGLTRLATYREFARRVEKQRESLLSLLRKLKSEGRSVAGYGAPAKGNTLLCYCGIGSDLLPYTVDRSPLKVGLHAPGSHIPVEDVARIFERKPEYVLILAWNFADEIIEFLRPLRERGTQFVLPVPEPRIV